MGLSEGCSCTSQISPHSCCLFVPGALDDFEKAKLTPAPHSPTTTPADASEPQKKSPGDTAKVPSLPGPSGG